MRHNENKSVTIMAGTLGDPSKYKTLSFIADYINNLDPYRRRRAIRFIQFFNVAVKDVKSFNKEYLRQLVLTQYKNKVEQLCENQRFSEDFKTYMLNFVKARLS